jgi:phosphoadenosine phosphosulfate reductase
VSVDLLDELEAGDLSVEFEGAEPQELLEWAFERFAPAIAISTAFQVDGVALIDMAAELVDEFSVFSVDTGRLPAETYELV